MACGREDLVRLGLGEACLRRIPGRAPSPCPRCAASLGPGIPSLACPACGELRPRFAAARAAAPYAGFVGELVRRAKYGRDVLLAGPLSGLLVDALAGWEELDRIDVVACAPAVPRRRAERGFHLAELLAERVAQHLGRRLRADWLVRVGDPPPQASLSRSERRTGARGTVLPALVRRRPFRPRQPRAVPGSRVLLVDDVLTTGSTADACARALLDAGVAEVLVAVVARA